MAERPEKRKGERAPSEATEEEIRGGRRTSPEQAPGGPRTASPAPGAGAAREEEDPREEEGWDQPESSAQKGGPAGEPE